MNASAPKTPSGAMAELNTPDAEASDAFTAHHAFLKSYFAKRLRVQADAEDCVHEVYTRVLAATGQDREIKSWRGILIRVARSVIIDKFRRDGARGRDSHVSLDAELDRMADTHAASPEVRINARQQLDAVWRVLQTLDPECREAFLMARVEGFAHKEIAQKLGIGTVAVGRHIQRVLFELARNARNT